MYAEVRGRGNPPPSKRPARNTTVGGNGSHDTLQQSGEAPSLRRWTATPPATQLMAAVWEPRGLKIHVGPRRYQPKHPDSTMTERPTITRQNCATMDVVQQIGRILNNRTAEQVDEILGMIMLNAAAQGVVDVEVMARKILEMLPAYKEEMEKVRLDS